MKLKKKGWQGLFPTICPWSFDDFMTEDFLTSGPKGF